MTVATDTKATLDGEYRSAKAIWRIMNCWSPITVKKVLDELVLSGDAERRSVPIPGGERYEYRRVGA